MKAQSEQCDDGNTAPGDGCSWACKVEPGWVCAQNGTGPSKCTYSDEKHTTPSPAPAPTTPSMGTPSKIDVAALAANLNANLTFNPQNVSLVSMPAAVATQLENDIVALAEDSKQSA